jgi:delta-aminolevulinic acid dehydratase/porphobilinogen synthase
VKGAEASGSSRSAILTADSSLDEFTDQQLEQCLASRQRAQESGLMDDASASSVVDNLTADSSVGTAAVGPTPYIDMKIGEVLVRALVDSGSQSIIIFTIPSS